MISPVAAISALLGELKRRIEKLHKCSTRLSSVLENFNQSFLYLGLTSLYRSLCYSISSPFWVSHRSTDQMT